MELIRFKQFIVLLLFAAATASHAGALAGNIGPIDYAEMQDYPIDGYEEPAERDPFTTSDKMFRTSGQQGANRAGGQGFVPYMMNGGLPKMRVRGFVHNGPGEALALLQIEGDETVHLVRKGDEIGIQSRTGQPSTVLKILNVDLKKVEVQSGSLRQIIIVQ